MIKIHLIYVFCLEPDFVANMSHEGGRGPIADQKVLNFEILLSKIGGKRSLAIDIRQ